MKPRGSQGSAPRGIEGLAMVVIQEATNDLGRPHRHTGPRAKNRGCRRCEAVAFLTGSTPAWRVARDTFFCAAGLGVPAIGVVTRLVDSTEARFEWASVHLRRDV